MFLRQNYQSYGAVVRLVSCLAALGCAQIARGQVGLNSTPQVAGAINERSMVTLSGNTHPLAIATYDTGAISDSMRMEHMYLLLRRSPQQEQALDNLLTEMQNRLSANYHHWLTADELGKAYGPAQSDVDAVIAWLTLYGLQVNGVSKSGLVIDVSGTAGQVKEAFHTEMHSYNVKGEKHVANASNPQVPAALASVIVGFNSLNDFKPKPQVRRRRANFSFAFDGAEEYNVAPADFARIYNIMPLYQPPLSLTGKGQTIAVAEDSDILASDVATFRKVFGLSGYSGTFTQIHPGGCTDPGTNGAEGEGAIDAEWAGAVAPDAGVELASCADTQTNYGFLIAAQNLVDEAVPPPIISMSYGICESFLGPAGNYFVAKLWQQAALLGISAFVGSGDGGAAFCDENIGSSAATLGITANGIASTPYNFAAGGTDFLDTAEGENSVYWSTTNGATGKSVKSYVPETTWNDSCASSVLYSFFGYTDPIAFCNSSTGSNFIDTAAGSGAPSFVYVRPSWQKNVYGLVADGVRDLPDASLFTANGLYGHALLFCFSDPAQGGSPCDYTNPLDTISNSGGGTSFAAPSFAGIQALINQKSGSYQGNVAPIYYDLARLEYGTSSIPNTFALQACSAALGNAISPLCLFNDVTVGNIDVPCYGRNNCYGGVGLSYGALSTSDSNLRVAYPAKRGWDFATGLGSVNVTNIVLVWP